MDKRNIENWKKEIMKDIEESKSLMKKADVFKYRLKKQIEMKKELYEKLEKRDLPDIDRNSMLSAANGLHSEQDEKVVESIKSLRFYALHACSLTLFDLVSNILFNYLKKTENEKHAKLVIDAISDMAEIDTRMLEILHAASKSSVSGISEYSKKRYEELKEIYNWNKDEWKDRFKKKIMRYKESKELYEKYKNRKKREIEEDKSKENENSKHMKNEIWN